MSDHIVKAYDEDLSQLKTMLAQMGGLVEQQLDDAIDALTRRDTALADRVDTWLFDTEHPIGANPPCRSCEVFRWCEISPVSAVEELTSDLIPHVPVGGHDWAASDAVLAAESEIEDGEDFPF